MIKKLSKHVFFRYVIAGGSSAVVDLALLYLLHSVCNIYYLFSTILAFTGAFFVSFTLHRLWTFKSSIRLNPRKQVGLYLATSLVGLALNTLLMYISVDHFHIRVILSQILVGGLVACCTFFLSRNIVFKWNERHHEPLI